MENQMNFRISSALKNLIGKELITDEFVAVFELVKNSFDANATNVKVIFENQYNPKEARIVIVDNGKGMDEADLKNKWLFVGYSAKREELENDDYRDKIKSKRIFAGAKGVGRFSCDRLGESLNLITIKDKKNTQIENLQVEWSIFEEDSKREFINIPVAHKVLSNINYPINHGTVLEISKLRDIWDRERIIRLKHSLEKLINPIQENDVNNFEIEIIAENEVLNDSKEKSERNKVNGKIKNFILEALGLKTTQIEVELVENGGIIKTTLIDRGQLVYRIKEKNPYQISDIKIHLFQLNRSAKMTFTKLMGIEPVKYGSVFMYKNGFRIYPFGEPGEDILGIDKRKQQGYNRFLGTRDLTGRILIYNNQTRFKETTSRDGGLIKDKDYNQLLELFYEKALKRLEKYVVDVIKWGDERTDKETGEVNPELNPDDVKSEILDIIANLTKTKDIINAEYDENFLEIIDSRQEKSVTQIAKNFSRIAQETQNPNLIKQAKQAEQHVKSLVSAKKELENEVEVKESEKKKAERERDIEKEKNIYLFATQNTSQEAQDIIHVIHILSNELKTSSGNIAALARKLPEGSNILSELDYVQFQIERINKLTSLLTKANLKILKESTKVDIPKYIKEYLSEYKATINDIQFNDKFTTPFLRKISLLDLSVIMDNLISNSKKAGANKIYIDFRNEGKNLHVDFSDNGKGVDDTLLESQSLFERGITNRSGGSGIGLSTIKETMRNMFGDILFMGNNLYFNNGATFRLIF